MIFYNLHGAFQECFLCIKLNIAVFSGDQVTGNLADAFENADGTFFNFENQKADPYSNRDPRFDATILHHGSPWYANAWEVLTPTVIDINGVDNNKGNTTGYYIKKFISPAKNDYYFGTRQPQPYIQIRYAEILLNYAEACIGLGEEALARDALNQIRRRAGMPDLPGDEAGGALLARYRNERRVELAWENHRFFDVRRWMIAEQAYGDATGVTYDGSVYSPVVLKNTHGITAITLFPSATKRCRKIPHSFRIPDIINSRKVEECTVNQNMLT